jgi:hypothetical protein
MLRLCSVPIVTFLPREGQAMSRRLYAVVLGIAAIALAAAPCMAAEEAQAPQTAPSEGPPLPLHTIEGCGGGVIVPMAYLVNPPARGATFGNPP